jgi:hypothetical protein
VEEQKNYIQAMKICVELANNRLNIFSDKIDLKGRHA